MDELPVAAGRAALVFRLAYVSLPFVFWTAWRRAGRGRHWERICGGVTALCASQNLGRSRAEAASW